MAWERAILVTLAIVAVAVVAFLLYDLFRKRRGKVGDSCANNPCEDGLHCTTDKVCRIPLGRSGCSADTDCEEGVCINGECLHSMREIPRTVRREARIGEDCRERPCGSGLICSTETKTCVPSCTSDSDCGAGRVCLNGECVIPRRTTVTPCIPGSDGCGESGLYFYSEGWRPYSSEPGFSVMRLLSLPTSDGYSVVAIGETKIAILVGERWVPFFEASRGQTIIDATVNGDYFSIVVLDGNRQSLLVFRNNGRELTIASRRQLEDSWKSIDAAGRYSVAITTDNRILVGGPGFTEMKVILSSRRGADKVRVTGDTLYFIAAPLPNRPAQLMRVDLTAFKVSSVSTATVYDMNGGGGILALITDEGLITMLNDNSRNYGGSFSPASRVTIAGNRIIVLTTVRVLSL